MKQATSHPPRLDPTCVMSGSFRPLCSSDRSRQSFPAHRSSAGWFGLACCIGWGLVVATGCNGGRLNTYPVVGQVVFEDGTPVKMGTVETKSVQHGVQATGAIAKDGTFTLTTYSPDDGAVAGDHKCVIVQFLPTENIPNYRPSTLGVVHRRHSSYATSDLNFTIQKTGENRVRLVVQGVDGVYRTTDEHGHDPVAPPADTPEKSSSKN